MLNSIPVAGTFSKDSMFFGKNFPVKYITDSRGAMVRGNDGAWYLDWISGLGANLLGYDDRYINDGFYAHVNMMTRHGIAYSLPHELEYTVAEKLVAMLSHNIPHWNIVDLQVRWTLSGSEACNAAIRLAKAIKGHGIIASYGYHGQGDQFVAATAPAHGLYDVASVHTLEWGQLPDEDLDVAGVIIEIPPQFGSQGAAYTKQLREYCNRHNALLIIDEVVTGLRYGRGGACELFYLEPDIICMGKALGNGMPIAAVVAPLEYMNWFNPKARPNHDPVFISSTNVGSVGGLAAANFVIDYVRDGKYLQHLRQIGNSLHSGLLGHGYNVIGNYARNLILWEDDAHKAFTIDYFARNGVLLNRPNFANMAHKPEHVAETVEIAGEAMSYWQAMKSTERQQWLDDAPLTLFRNR